MIYLSGRTPSNFLKRKFYGLGSIEKITEKLVSRNEKIKDKIEKSNILELDRIKNKVNFKFVDQILNMNSSNKTIKKELYKVTKSLISR